MTTKKEQDQPRNGLVNGRQEGSPQQGGKSLFWAYFWWLFGGYFGAHHFYLGRDDHALIWICTLGGYGFGWLRDLFRIPTYVADANDRPDYVNWFKYTVRASLKPPFEVVRFSGATFVSWQLGQIFLLAIPEDEINGINFKPLIILVPLVAAYGTWLVGNVGRQEGSIWSALIAAYLCYPSFYYFSDDSTWVLVMALASSLSFDSFSKKWRLKKKPRRGKLRRFTHVCAFVLIYTALLASYIYFNATLTDSDGEEIKLSEAVKHFLTSPIWLDITEVWNETIKQAKHNGFWATWQQIIDLSDPRGELNAYRVLGLSKTASQSEVTARWRELSRDHHPDKVKGTEEERRQAQDRFLEIQQAYEILSTAKNRRRRRNRSSEPL